MVTVANLPKYHCELNPVERCWAQAKRHTRAYCNYNITGLRRNIPEGLDKVSVDDYIHRVRIYMFGHLLGHQAGVKLEESLKNSQRSTNHTAGLLKTSRNPLISANLHTFRFFVL